MTRRAVEPIVRKSPPATRAKRVPAQYEVVIGEGSKAWAEACAKRAVNCMGLFPWDVQVRRLPATVRKLRQ